LVLTQLTCQDLILVQVGLEVCYEVRPNVGYFLIVLSAELEDLPLVNFLFESWNKLLLFILFFDCDGVVVVVLGGYFLHLLEELGQILHPLD